MALPKLSEAGQKFVKTVASFLIGIIVLIASYLGVNNVLEAEKIEDARIQGLEQAVYSVKTVPSVAPTATPSATPTVFQKPVIRSVAPSPSVSVR